MALKALNSVAGFSVGETPANIILANGDITTNNISTTGKSNLNSISNVIITGGTAGQVIQTDGSGNLTFTTINTAQLANGNSNVQVLANGNITFSSAGNANVAVITGTGMNVAGYITGANITATGNISVNNYLVTPSTVDLIVAPDTQLTRFYSNVNPFSGGYSLGNSLARWDNVFANTANIDGNVSAGNVLTNNLLYANGQPWDLQEAAGSNTQIQYNDGSNNFGASAAFTFDYAGNVLTVNGNANITGAVNTANINSGTSNFVINANGFTTSFYANGLAEFDDGILTTGNLTVGNANLGNLAIANFVNVSSNINVTNTMQAGNVRTDNLLYANGNPWDLQEAAGANTQIQYNDGSNNFGASANFTYNDTTQLFTVLGNSQFNNANLGNLAIANFINVASNVTTSNVTINLELSGNTANFTGNVSAGNLSTTGAAGNITMTGGNLTGANVISANTFTSNVLTANFANIASNTISNNITVNLELSGNTANFSGNVTVANFIGALANGSSNVKVYSNANVEFTVNGVANVATISSTGLYVAGDINTTTGNMLSNGNVSANSFLNSANANVTGEALLGSVKTANITATVGNITISASGVDQNIILSPTGNGTVDVGSHRITQVADPTQPHDAATKEYVDSTAQGLTIHTAVRVTSTTNLNATYANGGSVLTTIAITGGKTIQFGAAHGLSIGDELAWDNSFNGLVGNDPYFVFSTPAADTITVKAGYFGAEVTTLTNGTGLSQTARANTGVGATLTNAGANAAISIDSVALASTNRVLVQGQTNQVENGIYTVTTVGSGATAWVLTRATDEDTYSPTATNALGYGDYFFVQNGSSYAGSSYVLTTPVGEILFGFTNIAFSQFSAAGSYSAGNGIAITGTTISANTDGVTTDIVGGNIVVKTSANLTTPNLGDATFSSLTWNSLSNGNVTANNLSISNIANITGNLRVDGIIESNGNITSNAFINGNNASFTNFANIGGNLLANNITSNHAFSTNTANISSNLVTSNATVNLALAGNTANFSGNVVVNNLTVNLELAGNTANFSGNIKALNANLGNLVTANFANFANDIVVQGNIANANNISVTNLINGNTANFIGNIVAPTFSANTSVLIGNTTITTGTLTTTSVSANQTIASFSVTGVTGVEYLVKAVDSTGSKYSVATVLAVTDGTNADYAIYGSTQLGGYTGSLAVNVSGTFIRLQVTPSSSNSTVWTTQYRLI